ncbi:unnamed protein product [Prorocentrum cordatum]|uniref:Helicase ATP-binding domain-containing protein n=1 Tax=Prorocentrum cordatum TaxID=2364126 RepID=A0ABN9SVQ6_9DINO|nr:unnamed protein product [Polarella glacialis]
MDRPMEAALREVFVRGCGLDPWPHQLQAVAHILEELDAAAPAGGDRQQNFLVQHSTGSGKSLTMALMAWALGHVAELGGRGRTFVLTLLLSDRRQLDMQLGDACAPFLSKAGMPPSSVRRCDDGGDLVKMLGDVASARNGGPSSYQQRFDRLFEGGRAHSRSGYRPGALVPILRRGLVAVVCEEAHRSHFIGDCTTKTVNRLFGAHSLHEVAARAGWQPHELSYIGFSATPDERTLKRFGLRQDLSHTLRCWRPVHAYHIGQAEGDGVIMDVLSNYARSSWPEGSTSSSRAAWLLEDLARKRDAQPADLRPRCAGMLVCSSRAEVVQWVRALRAAQAARQGPALPGGAGAGGRPAGRGCHGVFGFYSGLLEGAEGEEAEGEVRLNGGLSLPDACAAARVLVVCRKLETGYDNPHLCVLYSSAASELEDRKQIVQVLSRINRSLPGKIPFVVDFCNDIGAIQAAFHSFRCDAIACSEPRRGAAVAQLDEILKRLGSLLVDGSSGVASNPHHFLEAVLRQPAAQGLRQEPGADNRSIQGDRVRGLAGRVPAITTASLQYRDELELWTSKEGGLVFVDQGVARRQLLQIRPCARYGGVTRLAAKPGVLVEEDLAAKMRPGAKACTPGALVSDRCVQLRCEQDGLRVNLRGPGPELEALFAASERSAAFFRWLVQKICSGARDEADGRLLRLPFVWMADDLLVAFCRNERPLGAAGYRAPEVLLRQGFREAFLEVQRHPRICSVAVAGFLRDRGFSFQVRQDWLMDRSIALQKVMLLNLAKLAELGVEFCPLFKMSEDLALCFDVLQRPGGHTLKAQGYPGACGNCRHASAALLCGDP